MSEEKEKQLELKLLRLLTMNYMYLSYKYETLENIVNGITNKECLGLLEEKKEFDKDSDGFLNYIRMGFISQHQDFLNMVDENTEEYTSVMAKIVTKMD